ncbi:MAG: tol-pal system protein YbgF [Xanthomonadales bacterium]|nr:tol-pal system protein YbgF [Xanthomonadales bacterium]
MFLSRSKFGLMASLVLAIAFSTSANAQGSDTQAMMDLVIQVQQLQDEVRMLRGMLEEQAMELENLGDRQRDQYLDLDQRITELRSSGSAPRVATGVGGPPPAAYGTAEQAQPQTQPVVREDVPEVRPALDTPSTVSGIATPDTQARAMAASPEAEKTLYDQAFQSLKDMKYADAAQQFQSFLDRYPTSEYSDNAQYWLGESYYVTRNYEIALESFRTLLTRYPDSPKVADALLKIGYTHYELKQWDQARAALVQVQEQYPDTTLARLAGSRLRSMKVEGHF